MNIEDKQVFTEKKDFPLSTLREMVDDGDIIPNPEYQRDYVYTDKQASKLVESVLMGIPIPTIYLCVEEDNTYSVIDGQQRITSLIRYLKNEYALNGLQELNELNGKYYKDLPKDIQKKLKSSSLSTISLLKQSTDLKYSGRTPGPVRGTEPDGGTGAAAQRNGSHRQPRLCEIGACCGSGCGGRCAGYRRRLVLR